MELIVVACIVWGRGLCALSFHWETEGDTARKNRDGSWCLFIYLFHKGLTFIFKRVNRNPIMVLCCLFCIEPIDEASIMITWCSRRPYELKPYLTLSVACRGFGTVVRTMARNWHLWIFNFHNSKYT